jgi:hypothetical protein
MLHLQRNLALGGELMCYNSIMEKSAFGRFLYFYYFEKEKKNGEKRKEGNAGDSGGAGNAGGRI